MTNEEIRKTLRELAEPEFQRFTSSLMPGVDHVLGVRLPKLRKIAGKVCRCRGTGYLLNAWDGTYEEVMLQGMVIGCLKEPFETVLPFIRAFLPKIDNWSVCDSFCCSLKIARREPEAVWEFVTECLRSERPYTVRFAVVMLLNYYVDEAHLPQVLCALDGIKSDFYYVRMAVAWAVSVCFVKFPGPVMEYLRRGDNGLDDVTYQKALQKIMESCSVDAGTKQEIRAMKIMRKKGEAL